MEIGAKRIWLEGDSLGVVHLINSRRGSGGYSDASIFDMSIWYIREINMVTDCIVVLCSRGRGKFIHEELLA